MLKRGFKQFLAEANAVIETVSVQDLPYHLEDREALVVDVRESIEREAEGAIPESLHAPRGLLEFLADPASPIHNEALRPDRHLVLYCGSGARSALAAKTLLDMGFTDVVSLAGGYQAWSSSNERA